MGRKIQYIGQYQMDGQTLGKGNFARVELATHGVTKCKVAIKVIDTRKIKEEYVRNNLHREASVMAQLRHPNIIRLYETLKATSPTTSLYCLVTEYAAGGELLSFIKSQKDSRLTENTARPFIRQLVSALHYFHERGVVHRDLKMENIMLDDKKKNIKIVDFGLSNTFSKDELLKTKCGSPEYAAPELFQVGSEYGPEVDIWSLGIIFYAAVIGRLPFTTPFTDQYRRQKLLQQIQKGLSSYHDKEMVLVAPDCRKLLRQVIEPSPELRLTLPEIECHPWISRNGKLPFTPYQPPPKDKTMRAQVIEELSTLNNMDKKYVGDAVSENRADELSAMFNMMMDENKKAQGLFEVDHTVPKDEKEIKKDIVSSEKKTKLTKVGDHGKRDKRSQGKCSKSKGSNENGNAETMNGRIEAEVIVEKPQDTLNKPVLTLAVPTLPPPKEGAVITSNGPVRIIQHPLTTNTPNSSSIRRKDFLNAESSSCNTCAALSQPARPSSPLSEEMLAKTEQIAKSNVPTSRRLSKRNVNRDRHEKKESPQIYGPEHNMLGDKSPHTKPLRPSTLQYRKNTPCELTHVWRTQMPLLAGNKATGAIPKYTSYSPLIAPRAVPETLSSTDPTPDSMQCSLLNALDEKRRQSVNMADSGQNVLKEDKVSENMEILEQQISEIQLKCKDSRPHLVRYMSEPEHEASGASQCSITGSNLLYPGSGPLIPENRQLVGDESNLPKTDISLVSCSSGTTLDHQTTGLAVCSCPQGRDDPTHLCRTANSAIRNCANNQSRDSNSNTAAECSVEVFSSSPEQSRKRNPRSRKLAWQPPGQTRSPLNSSSTDDSPVLDSPRHTRFPNVSTHRKPMQLPIATVESYSEDEDDGEFYPRQPLLKSKSQQHTSSSAHPANAQTSMGNGTRTSPTAVRLKANKHRPPRESLKKYSKNGIFTSVPDNNLRLEPLPRDSCDSLAADTSSSSIKAGDGSLERLTSKARVHPMDSINKGEEDQPNASNGSAKTVPRVARSSGRISRFQVFNLLQHDTDKNLRQAPTSPTQKVDRQTLHQMRKFDHKRKHQTWRKGLSQLLGRHKPATTNNNISLLTKTNTSNGTARNSTSQSARSSQDKYIEMDKKWTAPSSPTQTRTCNNFSLGPPEATSEEGSTNALQPNTMFDISSSRSNTPSHTPQPKSSRKPGWGGCKDCSKTDLSSDEGTDTSYSLERRVSTTIMMQSMGPSSYEPCTLSRQTTTQT